jgi:hypothetical protein
MQPVNVSILGAGSAYGVYLVKWAYQLLRDPKTNREGLALPPIGAVSFSNTHPRNRDFVYEVLLNDLHRMPEMEKETLEGVKKNVRGYINWREMVAQEKPDLVVVCTPTETHLPMVRELVTDFGVKNILCESPVASLNEADALPGLKKLLEERGVTFGINFQYASLMPMIKDVPLQPGGKNPVSLGSLGDKVSSADITFITHGTRPWRQFGKIDESIILQDLGAHSLYFLPPAVRNQPVTVKNVVREGDNVVVDLVEYDLLFGETPVRLVLGYRRKLKILKVILDCDRKNYEFHLSGGLNPDTGEYTRQIIGKNYAHPFKHSLSTDLVKYSFMRSLARHPLVGLDEAIQNHATLRLLLEGSLKIK